MLPKPSREIGLDYLSVSKSDRAHDKQYISAICKNIQ